MPLPGNYWILDQVPGKQYLLPLIFSEQSQRTIPGNYGEEVGGPGPGTWKKVSSTFTPTSWSSPRGLCQVTIEKTLEVLCLGTWKTVSSTFTPSSWSSPRGHYHVTMEKKLEVLNLVPGGQYL